jgi:hypothetical protein
LLFTTEGVAQLVCKIPNSSKQKLQLSIGFVLNKTAKNVNKVKPVVSITQPNSTNIVGVKHYLKPGINLYNIAFEDKVTSHGYPWWRLKLSLYKFDDLQAEIAFDIVVYGRVSNPKATTNNNFPLVDFDAISGNFFSAVVPGPIMKKRRREKNGSLEIEYPGIDVNDISQSTASLEEIWNSILQLHGVKVTKEISKSYMVNLEAALKVFRSFKSSRNFF